MNPSPRLRSSRTLLTFGLALAFVGSTEAAPCCGGGAAIPSILTGDDRAQLQASLSHGTVVGDAPAEGLPVFRAKGDAENTQILRFDGAYRIADRFQFGAGIPIVRRVRTIDAAPEGSSGLGDIAIGGAYEILPEWTYSRWRPHGFLFLQSTLPTAPSTYDAIAPYQLDARGRGFFSVGAGTLLLKVFGNWDYLASAEIHRAFTRTVVAPDGSSLSLHPGFGGSATLGAGFSPNGGALRFGLGLTPVWEGGIRSEGEIRSESSAQLVWTVAASATYLVNDVWSTSASYADQTLVGPARNVSLSRTFALALQKRWSL